MFRRSPRALALWGAAGIVALVTAAFVASDLAAIHRRAADLGSVVKAVVATRELALGTTVSAPDLAERQIYQSQLPRGAVEGAGAVVGRVIAVPLVRGAFVTDANLAPRHRTGLDGAVPRGMRAMRVVVTNAVRPRAGAAVDLLATFDTASGDAKSATVVVAAGVVVIGTDRVTERAGNRDDTLGVVVLVDAAGAQRIAFAEANGVVTIALVPPEDAARR
jgi:Flp pilus assembly protein CpaB